MQIYVNDKIYDFLETASASLEKLLQQLDKLPSDYAIAVNQNFVPRSEYAEFIIQAQDRIDIIVPMQGG